MISAVVISSALLIISFLFKSYFIIDTSDVGEMDIDLYLKDVVNQLEAVKSNGCDWGEWKETVDFNKKQLAKKGYYLEIFPESRCSSNYFINISSESMNVCLDSGSGSRRCAV